MLVKLLLERGAKTEHEHPFRWAALGHAAKNNHVLIVKALLDKGANIEANNGPLQRTPLIEAATNGCTQTVDVLLAYGAQPNAIDRYGDTALIQAVSREYQDIPEMLLKYGAATDKRNQDGKTALDYTNCEEIQELLTSYPRNSGKKTLLELVDEGLTAEVIGFLSNDATSINESDPWGFTALIAAAQNGHALIVQALLKNKNVNIEMTTVCGNTALIMAAGNGHESVVRALLAAGANLDATNASGNTAKVYALRYKYKKIVELLTPEKQGELMANKSTES